MESLDLSQILKESLDLSQIINAAACGDVNEVERLHSQGGFAETYVRAALFEAVLNNKIDVVKYCLGFKISPVHLYNIFMCSIPNCNMFIIKLLARYVNSFNSAIIYAVVLGRSDVAAYLFSFSRSKL